MSFIGSKVGNKFGTKYEKKAQLFGGIILVLIGDGEDRIMVIFFYLL